MLVQPILLVVLEARVVAALGVLLLSCLFGCTRGPDTEAGPAALSDEYETLELRYQGATGGVIYPELAADLGYLEPIKLRWEGNTNSGPQDIQAVVTNDTDCGLAFNGSIIKLIAAGAPIRAVVGAYTVDKESWSGFYVLDGSPIRTARDFIGKKVGMNTLGAHSEFMLKEFLSRHGLSKAEVEDVALVVIPPINSEQSLRQKQLDVATLGGVLRDKALERGGVHPIFTDYELFGEFTSASYVLRKDFIDKNPRSARKFVEATARALEWSRSTPREQVIQRFEKIIAARRRNEDASALKYWRPTHASTSGGVIAEREFQLWLDWLEREGQLKRTATVSTFYSNELNPFATTSPRP